VTTRPEPGKETNAWLELTTEDVATSLSTLVLVDALGPPYFETVHLPGAINIPPHEVATLAPTALSNKSAQIVVYATGSSSNATIVLQQLAQLGYHHLALYVEGIDGWIEAGLPVSQKA
jgi:rhodanese-related sulfurtransferase